MSNRRPPKRQPPRASPISPPPPQFRKLTKRTSPLCSSQASLGGGRYLRAANLWEKRALCSSQSPAQPSSNPTPPQTSALIHGGGGGGRLRPALRRRDALIAAKDNDGAKAIMEELLQEGVRLDNSRRKWTTVPARPTDPRPPACGFLLNHQGSVARGSRRLSLFFLSQQGSTLLSSPMSGHVFHLYHPSQSPQAINGLIHNVARKN